MINHGTMKVFKTLLAVLVTSFFLPSGSSYAAPAEIIMKSPEIELGYIGDVSKDGLNVSIPLVRTSETPNRVRLLLEVKEIVAECVHWSRDMNRCRYYGGSYFACPYTICDDYKDTLEDVSKTVKLVFRKAEKLSPGDREIFDLQITAKEDRPSFKFEAPSQYEVKKPFCFYCDAKFKPIKL